MGGIGQNALIENTDSCNGGLQFVENVETLSLTKEQINKAINLPNGDVAYPDIEVMNLKPKMPSHKRKNSRNSHASKTGSGYQGLNVQPESDTTPISPAIRRSTINNLVGGNSNTSSTDDSKYSIRNEPLPDMRSPKNSNESKRFNVRVASINSSSDSNPVANPHGIVGN